MDEEKEEKKEGKERRGRGKEIDFNPAPPLKTTVSDQTVLLIGRARILDTYGQIY